MLGLSPAHLLIILVIALIVVGPGKLPEVGAAIGKSLREFQKASGGITDTLIGTAAKPAQQPTQPQSYYAAPPFYAPPVYAPPVQPQYVPAAQPPQYAAPVDAPSAPPVYAPPVQPQYVPAAQPPQYAAPVNALQPGIVPPAPPAPATNDPAIIATEEHPAG